MPKRNDIETILVIGSGPIVIGQACEFDYSGTQACKVLKDESYRVVLVNDEKNGKLYEEYKKLAEKEENIIFGGRLGEYKYYDMDAVIAAALDMCEKEL